MASGNGMASGNWQVATAKGNGEKATASRITINAPPGHDEVGMLFAAGRCRSPIAICQLPIATPLPFDQIVVIHLHYPVCRSGPDRR